MKKNCYLLYNQDIINIIEKRKSKKVSKTGFHVSELDCRKENKYSEASLIYLLLLFSVSMEILFVTTKYFSCKCYVCTE